MTGSTAHASQAQAISLPTAEEMRRWDQRAIRDIGVPEEVLIEAAGRAAAAALQHLFPTGRIVAAVGKGNNAADAIVALRTMRSWGRDVAAIASCDSPQLDSLLHGWDLSRPSLEEGLSSADLVLDGILGTGARGAPRQPEADLIRRIDASGKTVVALDGPSGVDMTTGVAHEPSLRAAVTLAMGAPKRGLLLFPGRRHAGRILVLEIGLPPGAIGSAFLVTPAWVSKHLPRRAPNAHKGRVGALVVLAGRSGMAGAAILCARGALRAGAGVVRMASSPENRTILQTAVPEAIFVDREDLELESAGSGADVLLAGPGMGTDRGAAEVLSRALRTSASSVVLDADGLTLLGRHPEIQELVRGRPLLMTPHPGEAARLLDLEVSTVVAEPFEHARILAERFGGTVLLKGSPSVVASCDEPSCLASAGGHSGVATSGMGDTLAGIAAAFLGQGCEPRVAAALAHAVAGRAAEIAGRGVSLLPGDVAEALPEALAAPTAPPSFPGILLDIPPPT